MKQKHERPTFQAKKKKPNPPPEKKTKPKGGETSKPSGSSKSTSNEGDNMFQVGIFHTISNLLCFCFVLFFYFKVHYLLLIDG